MRFEMWIGLVLCTVMAGILGCHDGKPDHSVRLSVAASTDELMRDLVEAHSAEVDVAYRINTGPSSSLAHQVLAGAPVDLFLSASREWGERVNREQGGDLVSLFANRLVLVANKEFEVKIPNPDAILESGVHKLAVAGESVPAGIYARQALEHYGVWQPMQNAGRLAVARDVRSTLAFVSRGEAELGVVYATDLKYVQGVRQVLVFDDSSHAPIEYVCVLTVRGQGNPAARSLFAFLQTERAARLVQEAGFLPRLPVLGDASSD